MSGSLFRTIKIASGVVKVALKSIKLPLRAVEMSLRAINMFGTVSLCVRTIFWPAKFSVGAFKDAFRGC